MKPPPSKQKKQLHSLPNKRLEEVFYYCLPSNSPFQHLLVRQAHTQSSASYSANGFCWTRPKPDKGRFGRGGRLVAGDRAHCLPSLPLFFNVTRQLSPPLSGRCTRGGLQVECCCGFARPCDHARAGKGRRVGALQELFWARISPTCWVLCKEGGTPIPIPNKVACSYI